MLALEEIARDPALIRPGVPDASGLYLSILANRMPPDSGHAAAEELRGDELQALRDWINELPVEAGARCAGRKRVAPDEIGQVLSSVVSAADPATAERLRFISLAHLHNACLEREAIEGFVQGVRVLIAGFGRSAGPGSVKRIGPGGAILVLDLAEAGWVPAQWEVLAAADAMRSLPVGAVSEAVREATQSRWPLLAADRMAHNALQGRVRDMLQDLAAQSGHGSGSASLGGRQAVLDAGNPQMPAQMVRLGLDPKLRIWGLTPLGALGHAYRRPADLRRAAADFGIEPEQLFKNLKSLDGADALTAGLLRQGVARRADVERLLVRLAAREGPLAGSPAQSPTVSIIMPPSPDGPSPGDAQPFDLAVWGDKNDYAVGDPVVLHAQAGSDCYLTLIGVDKDKRAIVLFPNDFERNNKLAAGQIMRVPGAGAGYAFRFDDKARELIVGICSKTAKPPDSIVHDFERLRFTVLGDWQIFLREPLLLGEAGRDDAATAVPRPKKRNSRRGRSARKDAPAAPVEPAAQARAAFVVNIR